MTFNLANFIVKIYFPKKLLTINTYYNSLFFKLFFCVSVLAIFLSFSNNSLLAQKSKDNKKLTGSIKIDGSSTVYPISEAVAEEFQSVHPKIKVTIGVSGTGGGFQKFIAQEIDINNASRKIKSSEVESAKSKSLSFIELPVAYDGISVVVHKSNNWINAISVNDLKKIWSPDSKIIMWSDINPDWPKRKIKLYAPGADSGTFDYFTEKINGKSRLSRSDYTASEDDSVLIKGVSGDKDSLGYFGYAYYEEHKNKLKSLAIIDPNTPEKKVFPSHKSIADGSYYLSRPIFIYVSSKKAIEEHIKAFVIFYLTNAASLVKSVGYIPMSDSAYNRALSKLKTAIDDYKFNSKIKKETNNTKAKKIDAKSKSK